MKDQETVQEKTTGQPDTATKKDEPKEPLTVLKISQYDKESGQKIPVDKPIYTIEELVEYAQKGISFDSKNEALNALIRNEGFKIGKELAEKELEPRVQKEVDDRLKMLKDEGIAINEDLLNDGDPKEIAKAIRELAKKHEDLSDFVTSQALDAKDRENLRVNYNAKIKEVLQTYPNVKEETLVPFVANVLFPRKVDADAIGELATLLNGFANAGIDVDKLKPEDREKLEKAFRGKEEKAPSPGVEGKAVTKEEPRPAPKNFDETIDRIKEFTDKWMQDNK